MSNPLCSGALMAALLTVSATAMAVEDTGAEATEPAASTEPSAPASSAEALTPEEKAEKEARKACKIEICDVLATKDPAGPDISCDIVKTWRAAAITKMLGGKFDWPWGKAVCQSKLVIKREVLAKAMSEASYEVVMPSAEALLHPRPEEGGQALRHRCFGRAEGRLRERQGGDGEPELG